MFLDASAAVAMLSREADADSLSAKMGQTQHILFSALAHYETCVGYARARGVAPDAAEEIVLDFLKDIRCTFVEIDEKIARVAMDAHTRFGKGRHKAALNMGDCFAYACAKVHRVPLLCKGDDFIHTDIELA
jgi:ribonuclease VapC